MDANNTAKRPRILASSGWRLAAPIIDCAIAVLIFFIVKFSAGALSAYVPAVTPKDDFLSAFFAAFAYFLLANALPNGQSLGKRVCRAVVVGYPYPTNCTAFQSFLRNFPKLLFSMLDGLFVLFRLRRRLGYMLAKTIVINT